MKNLLFVAIAAMILFTGCEPEPGLGGKAEIKGLAAHHANPIAGTRVFIKYDAIESPGTDLSVYDDSTVAGSDGRFVFSELKKGGYYLYGIGFDSLIAEEVRAGMPVIISERTEVEEVTLPVTE